MKRLFILIFTIFILLFFIDAQPNKIKVSNVLEVVKITENSYMHTSESSNGIIYINNGAGIIVSTPPSDKATEDLIQWVQDSLKVRIIAFVIDSWHPDNMEGLDVVHKMGIKSYANEMTINIAKQKSLPVPQIGFTDKLEIPVGKSRVVCRYFGPAHTADGIMVWLPSEKVLFGNNGVRNFNGWIGNVGDANIAKWSETITKAKTEFPDVKFVVPGHGDYGGPELLDYTINLYKSNKWGEILKKNNIKPSKIFVDYGRYFITAQSNTINENVENLENGIVFFDKGEQYVMVEAPQIKHLKDKQSIESDFGRIKILNKSTNAVLPETDGYYKSLIINMRNDAVGMTIIMKEFIY
jgi:glyoxylase-like metal-dependent hydrolase (beta-lactamase superfamily II)